MWNYNPDAIHSGAISRPAQPRTARYSKRDAITCTARRERTRRTYRDPRWTGDRAHRMAERRRYRDWSHHPWSPTPSQCCMRDLGAGNPGPDMSWCGECRMQRGLALDQLESFPFSPDGERIGQKSLQPIHGVMRAGAPLSPCACGAPLRGCATRPCACPHDQ